MSWKNPRWSSITDPDLRAVFQSLEDFLRQPTFDAGIQLGKSDGSSIATYNPATDVVTPPVLPEVGNDNLASLLPDGSIQERHLADAAASLRVVADGSVDTTALIDNAVTEAKHATNSVSARVIAADAVVAGKINADAVTARELAALNLAVGKYIRSTSYVAGSSGWAIDSNGTAEFNNVTVRGTLAANTVNGWLTTSTGGGFRTASSGQRIEISQSAKGTITFYTGQAYEANPAAITASTDVLILAAPTTSGAGGAGPQILLRDLRHSGGVRQLVVNEADQVILPAPAVHAVGGSGEPAFQNSWTNLGAPFGGASFYLDAGGQVHLNGLIKSGSAGGGVVIFTLPAGYRPATQKLFHVGASGGQLRIDVTATGDVQASGFVGGGTNAYVQLDGIVFPTLV